MKTEREFGRWRERERERERERNLAEMNARGLGHQCWKPIKSSINVIAGKSQPQSYLWAN